MEWFKRLFEPSKAETVAAAEPSVASKAATIPQPSTATTDTTTMRPSADTDSATPQPSAAATDTTTTPPAVQPSQAAPAQLAEKPRASVFVDFEHWYYSLKNNYGLKPDPFSWQSKLSERFQIESLSVFANFGDENLSRELPQIRSITNQIIESRDHATQRKDMTDFIMLDSIYQHVDSPMDTDTYILFTGDGHFQSVVKYLKQRKQKTVVIYGIKNALSRALQTLADECIELPFENDVLNHHIRNILENLDHFAQNCKPLQHPTFMGTVEAVARHYESNTENVTAALSWLIQQGYIEKTRIRHSFGLEFNALQVNWELLIRDRYWKA